MFRKRRKYKEEAVSPYFEANFRFYAKKTKKKKRSTLKHLDIRKYSYEHNKRIQLLMLGNVYPAEKVAQSLQYKKKLFSVN